MIKGVGTDLIEIERVKKACAKEAFLLRVFTEQECRQAGGCAARLAGNFAVKEAVSKVFGTGFRGFSPRDIEVLRDELGKPYVNLYGKAKETAKKLGIRRLFVSISNTARYASAYAVGEGDQDETPCDRKTDERD